MPGILDTPKKAKILGALQWSQHLRKTQGVVYKKKDIAQFFGIHPNTITKIAKDDSPRTGPSINGETRGRKRKLTDEHCQAIERLYKSYPDEAPDMPWDAQLMSACDVEANSETVGKAMRRFGDYGKYIADEEEYTYPKDCKAKVEHCRRMLEMFD